MTSKSPNSDDAPRSDDRTAADLETVLCVWHDATVRWEETQHDLEQQVLQLSTELDAKNHDLREQRRLARTGQAAGAVAQTVRQALVPLLWQLNMLRRRLLDDPAGLDLVRKIETAVRSVDNEIDDLWHLAYDSSTKSQPIVLRSLVDEALDAQLPQLTGQGVTTSIDVPASIVVMGDRDMLYRAVVKLLLNALVAMRDGGELVVTAYAGARSVELEIADSGADLDDGARVHQFEPFRLARSGAGAGLALAQQIAEAHGGDVVAANCAQGGAAFTLRIPRRPLAAAA